MERARVVIACIDGEPVNQIAERMQIRPNTVIDYRRRFAAGGMPGLKDRPRSGKPKTYGAEFRTRVLELLETPPPAGYGCWDGPLVAKHLGVSDDAVWRLLRKEGVCLKRQRSWCVSTDPEFAAKAADVIGLLLESSRERTGGVH